MDYGLCLAALACLMILIVLFRRHQRRLERRAWLMLEAIKNRDFSFRLPTRGLLPGERAMQEALNELGIQLARLLRENEVESWRRVARVMTHEIMNNIAPIASISQSLKERPDVQGTQLEPAVQTIYDTSRHLTTLVEDFRQLTMRREVHRTAVSMARTVEMVSALFPTLDWHIDLPEGLTVETDEGILRQTLTNLTKNAKEAGARIVEVCWQENGLLMSNDGEPIPADLGREIFTPFFTTKRGGSGIGLVLSRQLLVVQGGDLTLERVPRRGFTVTFRATLTSEP
ncbi:MAG: HAMP domain-containing histidine kinase [Bacteroidaceae bacterium]|nr:HAMP domain-containing histidine kinase [Bacteroidaceae bacterium]